MSKILKNTTGSPVDISDVGVTVPASSQITIPPTDYLLYADSDNVITLVGAGTLVVNDGSSDLGINEGSKLLQGIFPNPIGIQGADGTQIGNNGDSLKTEITASVLPSGAATESKQDTGNSSLSSIDSKVSTASNQSTLNSRVGTVTETAPATDTASSGLNGRLQRIAQRVSTFITGLTDGTYQIKLRGNTDGTNIGNTKDRLRTISRITDEDGGGLNITNFSEARTVVRNIAVEAKFLYNINTIRLVQANLNGGSVTQANRQATISSSTATNGVGYVRTTKTVDYRVSQAIEASWTGYFAVANGTVGSQVGVANNKSVMGLTDRVNENRISFGFNGATEFKIFILNETVETIISQSSFNRDRLDGATTVNGEVSEYAPDWTKIQLVRILYSWHGASPAVFQIQTDKGVWRTFHVRSTLNTTTLPNIGIPILSLFASSTNSGSTLNNQVIWQAGQISFLGQQNESAGSRFFSFSNTKSVSGESPVLTIRNNNLYATKRNFINLLFDYLSFISDGNKPVVVRIYKNATLTGATFANTIDAVNSTVSADTAATSFSGGTLILPIGLPSTGSYNEAVRQIELLLDPTETYTFTAQSQSSNSVTVGVRWRELH
jgi:hypothetical protein